MRPRPLKPSCSALDLIKKFHAADSIIFKYVQNDNALIFVFYYYTSVMLPFRTRHIWVLRRYEIVICITSLVIFSAFAYRFRQPPFFRQLRFR